MFVIIFFAQLVTFQIDLYNYTPRNDDMIKRILLIMSMQMLIVQTINLK